MIRVCGLWKTTSKDGSRTYYTGTWGKVKVFVYANKFKTKEEQPDFEIYLGDLPKPNQELETGDNNHDE